MFPEARWVPCITLTRLTLHVMLTVRFMLTLTFLGSHNGLPFEQLKIELKKICLWTINCCTWVCISTIETKSSRTRCRHTRSLQTTSAEQGVTVTWGNQIAAGFESVLFWLSTIRKNIVWINYIWHDQQQFVQFSTNKVKGIYVALYCST